ncbi:MmcQ/YjbR family DNA-binding protein [Streptococcus caprae]|uniref:MmcQ/YjbR family DNA-binding protein n=1 Tax=Streptococcus caprae TaxID=1640501 RepID=A0ABV8CXN8_9STRE
MDEQIIFQGKTFQIQKLLDFGFKKKQGCLTYSQPILGGEFEVRLRVVDGQLTGQVWDCDMNEEYRAFRVVGARGAFVGQVREAYLALLGQIAELCCLSSPLLSDQGNRLVAHLQATYGDTYDHPFAKYPNYTAFREPIHHKWYGLVTQIKRQQLDLSGEDWSAEQLEDLIEVINVKVEPNQLEKLLGTQAIYPAYHMNKKSWVTVVLDEGMSDTDLFDLVATSRQLTLPKGYRSATGPDYWVIPANPKRFDIDAEFAQTDDVYWTQKSTIKTGDLVCMYITTPIQAVRYVCQVLEADIPPSQVPEEETDKPLMKVRRIHTFADTVFPFDRMKSLGVRAVRGPRRLTKEMMEAVQEAMASSSAIAQKEK